MDDLHQQPQVHFSESSLERISERCPAGVRDEAIRIYFAIALKAQTQPDERLRFGESAFSPAELTELAGPTRAAATPALEALVQTGAVTRTENHPDVGPHEVVLDAFPLDDFSAPFVAQTYLDEGSRSERRGRRRR